MRRRNGRNGRRERKGRTGGGGVVEESAHERTIGAIQRENDLIRIGPNKIEVEVEVEGRFNPRLGAWSIIHSFIHPSIQYPRHPSSIYAREAHPFPSYRVIAIYLMGRVMHEDDCGCCWLGGGWVGLVVDWFDWFDWCPLAGGACRPQSHTEPGCQARLPRCQAARLPSHQGDERGQGGRQGARGRVEGDENVRECQA